MPSKLEQYAEIQALVQKEARDIALQVYKEQATKYGVASVPLHTHNGQDSPTIGDASIYNFEPLPAGTSTPPDGEPGVFSPTLLGSQVVYNTTTDQLKSPATAFAHALHIIHGFGNPQLVFTSGFLMGNTSGTLTGAWPYPTTSARLVFSNGDVRVATLTNGSTSVSWSGGLTGVALVTVSIFGSPATFAGGNAPLGTAVLFVNPSEGVQLFYRLDREGFTEKWWGVTLTENEG